MLNWPVSVSPELVSSLADRVQSRRGRAWLLHGPVGIGASTLARAVSDELAARGLDMLEAPALPELRQLPLGAMLPALGLDPDGTVDDPPELRLQRLFARLSRGNAQTVLVVDAAEWLDELSAAAVYQLVRAYGVRCVLTARSVHTLPAPLLRLEHEGLLDPVAVDPLDDVTTTGLIEQALDTPVAPESLIDLAERSGGHPMFLRFLLDAAVRTGRVRSGPTGVVVDAPAPPARLVEHIEEWVGHAPVSSLNTLHLLAVAGTLPRSGMDETALDRLRALALVSLSADRAQIVFPLVGDVIAAGLTHDELDESRLAAASLLDFSDDDESRITRASLLAESSRPPATSDVATAAQLATSLGRHSEAVRLAERADALALERGEPQPVEALILRGESLWLLGRRDEADAAFDSALLARTDDSGTALAASRASAHWALRRHEVERGARIEQTALATIEDPEARAFLRASTATWRILMGDAHPEPLPPGRLIGSITADVDAVIDPIFVGTLGGILSGDIERARATIAGGRPHVTPARPLVRHAAELMDFGEAVLDAMDGDVDGALLAITARTTRRVGESAGTWSFGRALLEFHSGRVDSARHHAETAADQLAWRDLLALHGTALGLRATVAAWLGDLPRARALLAEVDAASRHIVLADLQAAQAESWIAQRSGAPDAAGAIERAVERAAGAGHDGWLAFAAHGAIRMDHPHRVLDVLRAASPRPTAASFGLIVDHAEALAARDAGALLRAAEALEAAGLRAGAHDAARQALTAVPSHSAGDLARRARVVLGRVTARLTPPPSPRSGGTHALSAREWSIATAAATRERNREIAERLGLSLRTVENHLASAYRKLGVTGRDELRAALEATGSE